MKKIQAVLIALSTIILLACGGSNSNEDNASNTTQDTADYEGMRLIDLSEKNIQAEIHVPGKQKGKVSIAETPTGGVEITVGKNFGIEVVPFGMSKAEKKKELEDDLVYTIEYLDENDQLMLYKKSIGDSGIDPEFHFYYETTINGDPYSVKSTTDEAFNEASAKKMLKSAKSLKGKTTS